MKEQTEQSAIQEIEFLRQQLVKTVPTKGYTSKETIQLSQELDKALNQYNQIQLDNRQHTSCRKVNSY